MNIVNIFTYYRSNFSLRTSEHGMWSDVSLLPALVLKADWLERAYWPIKKTVVMSFVTNTNTTIKLDFMIVPREVLHPKLAIFTRVTRS